MIVYIYFGKYYKEANMIFELIFCTNFQIIIRNLIYTVAPQMDKQANTQVYKEKRTFEFELGHCYPV